MLYEGLLADALLRAAIISALVYVGQNDERGRAKSSRNASSDKCARRAYTRTATQQQQQQQLFHWMRPSMLAHLQPVQGVPMGQA